MFPIITLSTWDASKTSPLCTFLVLIIVSIFTFYTLHFPATNLPNPHELFISAAANSTIAAYLHDLTAHPHLAGTEPSLETTRYVETHFRTLGLDTHTVPFKALLSYPLVAAVSMRFGNGTTLQLPLNEEGFPSYAASGLVQPYHAYAPSGSPQANVVFVNYGREEDYRALAEIGVEVSGCIVLARRGGGGGLSRGSIVEIAEGKGAVGVFMYAEGKKGVERGTVMRGIGDPLTPGWPSTEDAERLGLKETQFLRRFPKIASLPLPSATAQIILGSLGGPSVPHQWRDSDHTRVAQVGPGPLMVNFTYQGENRMATINNVFAVIRGSEEPDRYVLLGNHRDAWTYGAVDPNSGTATLLDIARRYALLMLEGWQPRRTLILCSWDAEEFGMVGSTEWVEQNVLNLGAKAVAYLNVDCAVQGPGFFVGATPQLDNLVFEVTREVQDPDSKGATLHDRWEILSGEGATNIQRLSAVDSDFAPFLQHAGVPSVDIYYGRDFPVYHTAFDSFNWIISHADPFFHRHVAVAGVWGLLGLRLADDPVLSFDYVSYADQLWRYKDVLSNLLNASVPLTPLIRSIQELSSAAKDAENEAKKLMKQGTTGNIGAMKIRALNDRLMLAERGFLDADGLKGSPWFKHLIYGPQGKHERNLGFFPGVGDAISGSESRTSATEIEHEIWRVARAIRRAADALRGQLF